MTKVITKEGKECFADDRFAVYDVDSRNQIKSNLERQYLKGLEDNIGALTYAKEVASEEKNKGESLDAKYLNNEKMKPQEVKLLQNFDYFGGSIPKQPDVHKDAIKHGLKKIKLIENLEKITNPNLGTNMKEKKMLHENAKKFDAICKNFGYTPAGAFKKGTDKRVATDLPLDFFRRAMESMPHPVVVKDALDYQQEDHALYASLEAKINKQMHLGRIEPLTEHRKVEGTADLDVQAFTYKGSFGAVEVCSADVRAHDSKLPSEHSDISMAKKLNELLDNGKVKEAEKFMDSQITREEYEKFSKNNIDFTKFNEAMQQFGIEDFETKVKKGDFIPTLKDPKAFHDKINQLLKVYEKVKPTKVELAAKAMIEKAGGLHTKATDNKEININKTER